MFAFEHRPSPDVDDAVKEPRRPEPGPQVSVPAPALPASDLVQRLSLPSNGRIQRKGGDRGGDRRKGRVKQERREARDRKQRGEDDDYHGEDRQQLEDDAAAEETEREAGSRRWEQERQARRGERREQRDAETRKRQEEFDEAERLEAEEEARWEAEERKREEEQRKQKEEEERKQKEAKATDFDAGGLSPARFKTRAENVVKLAKAAKNVISTKAAEDAVKKAIEFANKSKRDTMQGRLADEACAALRALVSKIGQPPPADPLEGPRAQLKAAAQRVAGRAKSDLPSLGKKNPRFCARHEPPRPGEGTRQ